MLLSPDLGRSTVYVAYVIKRSLVRNSLAANEIPVRVTSQRVREGWVSKNQETEQKFSGLGSFERNILQIFHINRIKHNYVHFTI
jgi:hypothetical protein